MTTLRTAGRTDIGQLRENNEDAIVSSDHLALVADGMGGHPGGEIAANGGGSDAQGADQFGSGDGSLARQDLANAKSPFFRQQAHDTKLH